MNMVTRRRFLVLTGTGLVALGGGAFALWKYEQTGSGGILTFQAITALPRPPLPAYASYVISGKVNLSAGTGTITKTVFAGAPQQLSPIALLTRNIKVTGVENSGEKRSITGVVSDPSSLQQGEEEHFLLTIDTTHQLAQTDFFGAPIQMNIEHLDISSS